jgi:hypothetical protein
MHYINFVYCMNAHDRIAVICTEVHEGSNISN